MIKASGMYEGRPMLVIGLSRLNCERLLQDKPIVFRATDADPRLPDLQVLIVAGETEDAIVAELKQAMPGDSMDGRR